MFTPKPKKDNRKMQAKELSQLIQKTWYNR